MTGPGRGPADRIIVGPILAAPGSNGRRWVAGIAIRAGRVVATGSDADLRPWRGPRTAITRLAPDAVLLPGIADGHLHLADAALAADRVDLAGSHGVEAMLAVLAAADTALRARGDREGWLLGAGWSLDAVGRLPRAEELDRVAPGRPVALWSADHHGRWVSSPALRRAGIDAAFPDPPGGRIVRDPDGNPTGVLLEEAATLVDGVIPRPDAAGREAAVLRYADRLVALGVTTVHDPGEVVPGPDLAGGPDLYRGLAGRGRLPLRVVGSIRAEQLELAIAAGFRTGRGGEAGGTERYRDGWLKLFTDGSLGSRTAALLAPWEEGDPAGPPATGPIGLLLHDPDDLARLAARAAQAGIATQAHAIGDRAVRIALHLLAGLPRVGRAAHRIEHAQLVAPHDRARFGELGIAASVQPCHLITDAPAARAAWGDRIAGAFPLRAIAASGGRLVFGTDAPVEAPDPWPGIAAAVHRIGRDGMPFAPAERMARGLALQAATRGAPRSLGVRDEGRLRIGDRADAIVIPLDALRAPVRPGGALAACRPSVTFVDGIPVWVAGGADPG